jgi:hypothetical protein
LQMVVSLIDLKMIARGESRGGYKMPGK